MQKGNRPFTVYWNYRVIRSVLGKGEDQEITFGIHEVYYENDEPRWVSAEPDGIVSDSVEDLEKQLEYFKAALSKPVLDMADFVEAHA